MYIPYDGVYARTAIIWLGEVGFGEGGWMPVTGEKRFANLFSLALSNMLKLMAWYHIATFVIID